VETVVHLVDGTYELFRAFYGAPNASDSSGREVGATRGFLNSLYSLLRDREAPYVAVAFDHVIESFRNDLFAGYKTGEGIDPALWGQSRLVERAAHALGVTVWAMREFEADDALATAAVRFEADPRVKQVVICSPDKDLAQCVKKDRIVCLDRMRNRTLDEQGVHAKFGIPPAAIPDYLALVGDSADGIPGIPRWGARSSSQILEAHGSIENIPTHASEFKVRIRGAEALAESLASRKSDALLYKKLATLRFDVPLTETLDDLAWQGARKTELSELCKEIGDDSLLQRVARWRD
jgi:5'-3' exonuclease